MVRVVSGVVISALCVVTNIPQVQARSHMRSLATASKTGSDKDDSTKPPSIDYVDGYSSEWANVVGPFGQCGGRVYKGPTICIDDWACVQFNDAFSQCLPSNAVSMVNSTAVITVLPDIPKSVPADRDKDTAFPTTTVPVTEVPSPEPTRTSVPKSTFKPIDAPTMSLSKLPSLKSAMTPTSSQMLRVTAWQQCGGKGFNYSKYGRDLDGQQELTRLKCIAGYQCDPINEYFFQCVPKHDPDALALWAQCGGVDYTGATNCIEGSVCKFYNPWYSQCVPAPTELTVEPPMKASGEPSTEPSNSTFSPAEEPVANPVDAQGPISTGATSSSDTDPVTEPSQPTTKPNGSPSAPVADPTSSTTDGSATDPSNGAGLDSVDKNPVGMPSTNPTEEPARDPTDSSVTEPVDDSTSDLTNAPTAEPVDMTDNDPTSTPVFEPVGDPVDGSMGDGSGILPAGTGASEPVGEHSNDPKERPVTEPVDEPVHASMGEGSGASAAATPTGEPVDETASDPTNSPVTEPIDEPASEPSSSGSATSAAGTPTSEPVDEPASGPTDSPATEPTNGPTSEPTSEPANEPSTGSTDPSTASPAGSAAATTDSDPAASVVGPWQQCGGKGFEYSKYDHGMDPINGYTRLKCTSGYQCDTINEYFFQCVPKHESESVALWAQCGGLEYVGETNCVEGAVCKYFNQWYSQCVPASP